MRGLRRLAPIALLALAASAARAGVSEEEAARLGAELTPFGAERAGNAAGSIPAWTGGITSPPASYQRGHHHPDPYADDPVLYAVTAANLERYEAQLCD
jgi:hypothetical protein